MSKLSLGPFHRRRGLDLSVLLSSSLNGRRRSLDSPGTEDQRLCDPLVEPFIQAWIGHVEFSGRDGEVGGGGRDVAGLEDGALA